jgi:uncharacterized protein (DUF1330 family)
MESIQPSSEQMSKFAAADPEQPLVMINLLKYRDVAAYAEDSGFAPCSGKDAYLRYGAVAIQKVMELGGKLLLGVRMEQVFIGNDDDEWDDVMIVYYPSRRAFLTMLQMPDYQAAHIHRDAGLLRTRLLQCDGSALPDDMTGS